MLSGVIRHPASVVRVRGGRRTRRAARAHCHCELRPPLPARVDAPAYTPAALPPANCHHAARRRERTWSASIGALRACAVPPASRHATRKVNIGVGSVLVLTLVLVPQSTQASTRVSMHPPRHPADRQKPRPVKTPRDQSKNRVSTGPPPPPPVRVARGCADPSHRVSHRIATAVLLAATGLRVPLQTVPAQVVGVWNVGPDETLRAPRPVQCRQSDRDRWRTYSASVEHRSSTPYI